MLLPPQSKWQAAWKRWKQLAHRAATFQARILLVAFYYTVLLPFALLTRLGMDPLRLSRTRGGKWTSIRDPLSADTAALHKFSQRQG